MEQTSERDGLPPFSQSALTPTDQLIQLLGAVDLRGKLPTRTGAAPYPLRSLDDVRLHVIHHTGDGPARPTAFDVATYQTSPAAGWPFPAIAYLIYVEADGTTEVCGNLEEECWSNGVGSPTIDKNQEGVYNQETIACCFSGQDPTPAQWISVLATHHAIQEVLGRPLVITGHGLLPQGGTSCPGPVATSRLKPPP